jgi:endoglucanase
MAQGIENRPAVVLLELDAFGSSGCLSSRSRSLWQGLMKWAIQQMVALPHTVVYIEGGYEDAVSASNTAKALNTVWVPGLRGFFTNDTHYNWTINEINWGNKVSKMARRLPFIVGTSNNGRGPKLNPHPVTQGISDLCNPPGRSMGPYPTFGPTDTKSHKPIPNVDAFVWPSVPGESSGTCNGGPPPGHYWPAQAIYLASRAQYKLGPSYPSNPY